MNTIKITITERHECLPFSELEPDVQERVIERYGVWNTDHDWWNFIYDGFKEYCRNEYGVYINLSETHFSGFHSQGDGADFTGRVVDIQKFLHNTSATRQYPNPQRFYIIIKYMFNEIGLLMTAFRGHDYYISQHCETETYYDSQNAAYDHTEQALSWLSGQWEDVCTDLASELYNRLEREYEYLTSADALSETFDANDCVFDIETGELFHREQAVA